MGPYRFKNEIEESDYKSWLEHFKTSKEWEVRVNLIRDNMRDLLKNWRFPSFKDHIA